MPDGVVQYISKHSLYSDHRHRTRGDRDMSATESAVELVHTAARAASDKLAEDILAFDVSEQLVITDAFLLCSAGNDRQVRAIVDEIEDKLREAGAKPVRREGEREGRWVLLDYIEIVIHVQHTEEREFYALERLWRDCPLIPLPADVVLRPWRLTRSPGRSRAADRARPARPDRLERRGPRAGPRRRLARRHRPCAGRGDGARRGVVRPGAAGLQRPRSRPRDRGLPGEGDGADGRGGRAAAGVRPGVSAPGLTRAEFAEQQGGEAAWDVHAHALVPGAETAEEVRTRIVPATREVLDRLAPGETAVLVQHGAALRIAIAGLLGWPIEASDGLAAMDNCAWSVLEDGPDGRAPTGVVQPHRRGLTSIRVACGHWLGFRGVARTATRRTTRGCGAVGSALAWHARGQGFESPQLHPFLVGSAPAQLVAALPLVGMACKGSGVRIPSAPPVVSPAVVPAQLVAALRSRGHGMQGVRGSNPLSSTEETQPSARAPEPPQHSPRRAP